VFNHLKGQQRSRSCGWGLSSLQPTCSFILLVLTQSIKTSACLKLPVTIVGPLTTLHRSYQYVKGLDTINQRAVYPESFSVQVLQELFNQVAYCPNYHLCRLTGNDGKVHHVALLQEWYILCCLMRRLSGSELHGKLKGLETHGNLGGSLPSPQASPKPEPYPGL